MKRLVEALLHAATYERTVLLDQSRDFQNSRPSYILPMVVSFVWVRVEFYSWAQFVNIFNLCVLFYFLIIRL